MSCSTFNVREHAHSFRASFFSSFIPRSSSPGFAYIALLVTIIIIGISLGAAGKYWSNVVLRDKEEELLFRGEQYRKAIDQYYNYLGRRQWPQSIDDLLKDSRSPAGIRHLRQRYKDPMTGEDFVEIKHPALQRIIGVRSSSDKESLKQDQTTFPSTVLVPNSSGTYSIPILLPAPAPKSIDTDDTAKSDSASSGKIKYSDWLFYTSMSTTMQQGNNYGGYNQGKGGLGEFSFPHK